MTREDHVLAMFAAANPVPDADQLVLSRSNVVRIGTAEQMEHTMADRQQRTPTPTTATRKQRPWLIGAAGAVIVLFVGAGLRAAAATNDNDAATPPPDATAQVEPEVAAVLSAINAYNAGDREAWAAAQANGEVGDVTALMMNANNQLDMVGPCRITATTLAGDVVVACEISARDDLYGTGGIVDTATSEYTLNDELKITEWTDQLYEDETGECCPQLSEFNVWFYEWLRSAHPDVHAEIGNGASIPGLGKDPAHMLIALDYVNEFVAQSDDYPLDTSNS